MVERIEVVAAGILWFPARSPAGVVSVVERDLDVLGKGLVLPRNRRRAIVDTSVLVAADADLSGLACQISAVNAAGDAEMRLARQHRLTLIQATYGHGIAFTDETAHHYGLVCGRLTQ